MRKYFIHKVVFFERVNFDELFRRIKHLLMMLLLPSKTVVVHKFST